ncbi:MAG: hypothetical protein GY930_01055 [bacterium]|nr:hypothetical protein [bacterium]
MILFTCLLSLTAPGFSASQEGPTMPETAPDLSGPTRLLADGVPIDVTVGHAAPHFLDFDGDGLRDLLVGEYGTGQFPKERLPEDLHAEGSSYSEGKLRIYRNMGTKTAPLFKDFEYLRAGKEHASIPTT